MKTIIKITGLLILSVSFNLVNAAKIVAFTDATSINDTVDELSFTINETGGTPSAPAIREGSPGANVTIRIALTGFELRGVAGDITGLSTYFRAIGSGSSITLEQIAEIPVSFGGTPLRVIIPVTLLPNRPENRDSKSRAGFKVVVLRKDPTTLVSKLSPSVLKEITGGGGATPPNYSISMEISGGNNLGTVASKELPLNIAVTNIASAPNTGDVVVALAKDSRITDVGTNCGGDDWALDRTNPVAYLFTYTANDKDFPPTTSASSTIVCPVTVTRPTTQSGKLQLNAVLRHGSGDTKTSNDVASIEVTYN